MHSPTGRADARGVATLVASLAAIYLVSQFLRNSVGVIAPNLAAEIGLSASEIGLLSSAFFFSFAAAQIPLGVALDRYGPKRCMLVCATIAFAGTVMFAVATTPSGLIASRILMGLGSSCYLMAPLALYARRFPPERFTALAGIQIGIGTVGTLLVTAPLAFATATIGWRMTFMVVAGVVVIGALLVLLVVPRDTPGDVPGAHRETLRESLAGVMQVVRMRGFWPIFLMQFVAYSSYVIIVGLWGGPYLTHIYGYDLVTRGELLMLPAISQIIGVVLWGQAQRFADGYRGLVLAGALLTAAALGLLAFLGKPEPWVLIAWLAVFGFLPAYLPVLISHGRSILPQPLIGRGMTLFNIGSMGGTFVVQLVSGALIDLFPATNGVYPLDAYRLVFAVQALAIVAACATYIRAAR
jgi:predicted MFS family arabinose efflux permease